MGFEKKFAVAEKQLANNHIYTSDDANKYCNTCMNLVSDAAEYKNLPEKIRKRVCHKIVLNFNIYFKKKFV